MAGRRSPATDIRELLRRLQFGEPERPIARDVGFSRNTVARYRQSAKDQGLLQAAVPEPAVLATLLQPAPTERPAQEQILVEPFRERVTALHERGVEGQAIWQLLVASRLRRQVLLDQALPAASSPTRDPRHAPPGGRPRHRGAGGVRLRRPAPGSRERAGPAGVGVRDDAVVQPASVRRGGVRSDDRAVGCACTAPRSSSSAGSRGASFSTSSGRRSSTRPSTSRACSAPTKNMWWPYLCCGGGATAWTVVLSIILTAHK